MLFVVLVMMSFVLQQYRIIEYDKLTIERHLGSGAFGDVSLATLNGERVAVKRLLAVSGKLFW